LLAPWVNSYQSRDRSKAQGEGSHAKRYARLTRRMRCRECGVRGRALISVDGRRREDSRAALCVATLVEQFFSGESEVFPTTRAITDDFITLPPFGLI
jgi:hypothetical protein